MTLEDIKEIAHREMERDGKLSKGIRVSILEKVKEGESFSVDASYFDCNRIGSELRRSSQGQRMRTKTIVQGKVCSLTFNAKK